MPYISLDNLTRYDGKLKDYAEDSFAPVEALNWQKTEKAQSVAFYPVPETALEPVVNFLFTETPPAEGTKAPDNPSTITGVSTITATRCETTGVGETAYTVDLGGTYYGGSVDLATGVMTVTHTSLLLNGSTNFSDSGFSEGTDTYTLRFYPSSARSTALPSVTAIACDRLSATPGGIGSSTTPGFYFSANSAGVNLLVSKMDIGVSDDATKATVQTAVNAWFATYPATLVYPLATPFTVQLTPTQIYSLSQPDPYAPRLNTIYSDQQSVQVGYPKSPQATAVELANAIVSLGSNL